jgi:hypothetical protein
VRTLPPQRRTCFTDEWSLRRRFTKQAVYDKLSLDRILKPVRMALFGFESSCCPNLNSLIFSLC